MRICRYCLRYYKHSRKGRKERQINGAWGSGKWPSQVYHSGQTRLCERHMIECAANGGKRRAKKLKATPIWADPKAIKAIYAEARAIGKLTGVRHEVDHAIPLRGERVSGLHVEANLTVLPASENRRKSNHFKG